MSLISISLLCKERLTDGIGIEKTGIRITCEKTLGNWYVKSGNLLRSQFVTLKRGQHSKYLLLDRDLAKLYGVETRVLNQAVRRNIGRFPEDFMFSLTRDEIMNLSQNVIRSKIKHAPNVFTFTEQGVAMLSSVLKSERAVQVNIAIMRTFVKLR